ncbi:xylulokinase, partial [Lactobacillus sp. XV13L]|nr:xylulokinase [Lactobacillus sp. XV13L]
PYLVGERAPYADAQIRGSFIGLDRSQTRTDFVRAVLEGIVFSLKDLMQIYVESNSPFTQVIATGGGAKSPLWLQIQADIFNKPVIRLANEQTASLGAAMTAAVGLGWYSDFQDCRKTFVKIKDTYLPNSVNVKPYQQLYQIYHQVYSQTQQLSADLIKFRQQNNL